MATGEETPRGQARDAGPTAATLVGALYQLAADPEDWADFVQHLALNGGASDPAPAILAAMVAGSEQVARSGAAARPAAEAATTGQLAVLAVADSGRLVSGNAAARASSLGGLITGHGRESQPTHVESLRAARARLGAGDGAPRLVRLEVEGQARFAYAMRLDRLPKALAKGLQAPPRADMAIVAHAGDGGDQIGGGLADAFGLTPAEVRLALGLCEGASLRDFADQAGISINTARNQLNAIFEKVGVNRQTELVKALTELGQIWSRMDGGERRGRARTPAGFAPEPRTLRLNDGRSLTYRSYGPADGRPVLMFHGGLGASLLPPGTAAVCERLGLRIVAPERPGVGRSDSASGSGTGQDPASVGRDMAAVIDQLALQPAQFVSVTSGANFALATAKAAPESVSRILMLSPRPPLATDGPPSASPMVALQRRMRAHPWLAEAFFAVVRLRLSKAIVRQIMQASAVAPGDAAYLAAHPETFDLISLGMQEALTRTGQGTAFEITQPPSAAGVAALGPLPGITAWHGAQDAYAPPAEVAAWLGPALSELTVFEDIGNYLALKHWPEVLTWLAGSNRA